MQKTQEQKEKKKKRGKNIKWDIPKTVKQTKRDGRRNKGNAGKRRGSNERTRRGKWGGGKPERITERRRSGWNGDTEGGRLKEERQASGWFLSPPHPFLRVVLLRCLTEKRRRQICSPQPLLATNEFRLHPNELLAELVLHFYQGEKKTHAKPDLWSWSMALQPNTRNAA